MRDVRFAFRGLRRSRLFAAITTLTLGLGIGVLTALFAVVKAVLLDPIVPDQHRIVRIWKHDVARNNLEHHPIAYTEFNAWRDQTRTFEGLAALVYGGPSTIPLTLNGRTIPAEFMPVSWNFFDVLHAGRPFEGRWLAAADDVKTAAPVAVVSHRFNTAATMQNESLLGRQLTIAGRGRAFTVVGVAPAPFDFPLGTDVWVPAGRFFDGLEGRFDSESRRMWIFDLVGRLASGATLEDARAEFTILHERMVAEFPGDYGPMQIVARPLLDTIVGNSRQVLLFLFAAAGLVFVIAGVNVAALLMMRASEQRTELAVRIALGASRAQLAKQTLAESVALGGLGSVASLLIARALLDVTRWLAPADVPRIEQAAIDYWVFAFLVMAAIGWILVLGTSPIWGHRRIEAAPAAAALSLRGVRGSAGLRTFTVAQVAAAVIVSIAAVLLIRSFVRLQGIDRGFDANNLTVMSILLPESRYSDAAKRLAFYERLLPQIAALPGVVSTSPVHLRPGTGQLGLSAPMRFEGQTVDEAANNPWATWEPVVPSYFETFRIPIVQGRGFTDSDRADRLAVAIVSEAVARRYWPGQNPIGKRLKLIAKFDWVTVVGVAGDTRYRELTRPWLTVYFPAAQFFFFQPGSLVVRTQADALPVVPAVRRTIENSDPGVAIDSIATMDALLSRELSRPLTAVTVTTIFTLMAILLAAIGVYGVLSYEVRQRRGELAVRSALGATPDRIFRAVIRRSVALGATGAVAGLAIASIATRSLGALLYQLEPADPISFAAGAGALLLIALAAAYFPARRAARTDPVAVLRAE